MFLAVAWDFGSYPTTTVICSFLVALAFDVHWANQRSSFLGTIETLPLLVAQNEGVLLRKLDQAIVTNDYGAIIADSTQSVLTEFRNSCGIAVNDNKITKINKIILFEAQRLKNERKNTGFDPEILPTDGFEFEHWVAEAFEKFGWQASVSSASGDQGIDVHLKKSGLKVGVQAKLYSKPVGNSAVQEALAGKVYFGLDRVGVLSNAGFTPSAKKLAQASDVVLMSPHEIPNADALLLAQA
ncbi:restriction endonuclease [Cognatishimia activa]|uniref:Restriction endonuclease n=1 Tax=Cognatishimia activa TaxID=1715691 RepID=A0A975I6E9_9RHOB|nr:restriction endonuclease [Cognatishimia activa]QTN34839.1 restriction endonuclease [Cognatishimia activa]